MAYDRIGPGSAHTVLRAGQIQSRGRPCKCKDPAAAKRLVEIMPDLDRYNKNRIESALKAGYPGVRYDKERKKWQIIEKDNK